MKLKNGFNKFTYAVALSVLIASSAYAQRPTVQARTIDPTSVTGDLLDMPKTLDGLPNTRATSGRANYGNMSVILDLGGDHNVIGVIQDHGRWPPNYPGAYTVEVGLTASGPWLKTFEGPGKRGESKALFDAVRGRFIRVTAQASNAGGPEWTIAELKAIVDPGARPRIIDPNDRPQRPDLPDRPRPPAKVIRDLDNAFDKNLNTRAWSGTTDYDGMVFTFDLGGEYELSRVVQIHGKWMDDYPARYKIEVSRQRDEDRFREVWSGAGQRGRSVATFNPVTTRYIRITALRDRDRRNIRAEVWSIAELRTNRDPDEIDDEDKLARPIVNIKSEGVSNINLAIDDNPNTKATTRQAFYAGSTIEIDMGGSYTINKVVQIHAPNDEEFAGRYRLEVSEDGRRWRQVWEGRGEQGRSNASFEATRARYVRITATANRDSRHVWSIARLRLIG
jgi:hypothetical protein